MSKSKSDEPMTHDERLALIYQPFLMVRVSSLKGNSQAPAWVKRSLDYRQDKENSYERD